MAEIMDNAEIEPKVVEWEEEKEEEADGKLKPTCDKLNQDPEYHNRIISVENVGKVLDAIRQDMEEAEKIKSIQTRLSSSLTKDDAIILNYYRSDWKTVFDAVVKLRVLKADGKITTGTGFLITRPPGYNPTTAGSDIFHKFAVMTNFHVVRQRNGSPSSVNAKDIEVLFFYDCDQSDDVVRCGVSEISRTYSTPVPGFPTDERLDFAMLYIKRPDDKKREKILKKLEPLHLEEFGIAQAAQLPQIADTIRLCVIGHPHGAYKQIAFGKLETDTNRLYQGGREASEQDLHSVEHSVATCSGSSGSPVIMICVKEGKPVRSIFVPALVSFLHFQGNSKTGDAASMQSILPAARASLSQDM